MKKSSTVLLAASLLMALAHGQTAQPAQQVQTGSAPATKPAKHMKSNKNELTFKSSMNFEDTIEALKKASADNKFTVLHVHEISKIMETKGFKREPLTIIEICNAK